MILVLVLGLSLFTVATVAASTTNVGYEKFKEAMKKADNFDHKEEGQVNAVVTVRDNGEVIFTADIDAVGNEATKEASGNVELTFDGVDKAFTFYKTDDTAYVLDKLDGGAYKIIESDDYDDYDYDYEDHRYDGKDHSMTPVEEELLDYIVGDLKDNFEVTDQADGSTHYVFSMEGAEVPTLINLMVKAGSAAEHRDSDWKDEDHFADYPFMDGIDPDVMPDLVEDVRIEALTIEALVDANEEPEQVSFSITLAGREADGSEHVITVDVEATCDDSVTEVVEIDTDAYDWTVIDKPEDRHRVKRH